jgi:hypothetical protein
MTGCWQVLLVRSGYEKCADAKRKLEEVKKEMYNITLIDTASRDNHQTNFKSLILTPRILRTHNEPSLVFSQRTSRTINFLQKIVLRI